MYFIMVVYQYISARVRFCFHAAAGALVIVNIRQQGAVDAGVARLQAKAYPARGAALMSLTKLSLPPPLPDQSLRFNIHFPGCPGISIYNKE